jgi:bile acid:Na+ symporter, BASS family
MSGTFLTVIKAGLVISVFLVKFGIGLNIRPGDLRFIRERPGLMLKSLVAVTVLVPVAFLVIIFLVQPERPFAVALAILAASPAAPMVVGKVKKSGGSAGYAASLQLVVTLFALISTPLVLGFLSAALDFKGEIDPFRVAQQVFVAIFLPIGLGVMVGAKFPRLARLGAWLVKIAAVFFLGVLLLILTKTAGAFLHIDPRSYLAIALTALAAIAIGHLFAPKEPEMKTALALETAMRNPALALLIGTLNFAQTKPLPILIPCVVISVLFVTIYAKWQGRRVK